MFVSLRRTKQSPHMKIQTNDLHRYGQLITLPEPVGDVEFDSKGYADVTDEQYEGLVGAKQSISTISKDGTLISATGGELQTEEINEKEIEDQFNLDEEIERLKKLSLAELKSTAKDLGVEEVSYKSLSGKQPVIDLIVAVLTAPIDLGSDVITDPT